MAVRALSVVGTRPEAIKMAPLVKELDDHPDFESILCSTAQHREMLDQVLTLFSLDAHYDLNLMTDDQSLTELTARLTGEFEGVLLDADPDIVLVQGDTTTVLIGSLVGFYKQVKVGHVEAGLRTGDKYSPFPEEINRKLTDHISDFHFAPTPKARENLLSENIPPENIFVTGNTIVDALKGILEKELEPETESLINSYNLKGKNNGKQKLILVTAHRRESFGKDFRSLCQGIRNVVNSHENVQVVYPVHLNPNVQEPVQDILGDHERIHLIDPVGYQSFVQLMDYSDLVMTDSGGVQEEASSLGKKVLILRDKTERPEIVEAGIGQLVGTDTEKIEESVEQVLISGKDSKAVNSQIYGDGTASKQIVEILENELS